MNHAPETLRPLLLRSIAMAERDRYALACSLHDELSPLLVTAKMHLSRLLASSSLALVEESCGALERAIRYVRSLMMSLRPAELADFGLEAGIEACIEFLVRPAGLRSHLNLTLGDRRLPFLLESTAFRVVQEFLAEAVTNAWATDVWITAALLEDHLVLTVRAQGPDCDSNGRASGSAKLPSAPSDETPLTSQERVQLLGGRLVRTALPQHGAQLEIVFPLP